MNASALEILRNELCAYTGRVDVDMACLQAWALLHSLVEMIGTDVIAIPVSLDAVVHDFVSRLRTAAPA